jgi:hypothetical protein
MQQFAAEDLVFLDEYIQREDRMAILWLRATWARYMLSKIYSYGITSHEPMALPFLPMALLGTRGAEKMLGFARIFAHAKLSR